MTAGETWWTVRRTWHVQARTAMEALEKARPGEQDDSHVFESPLTEAMPTDLTRLEGQ